MPPGEAPSEIPPTDSNSSNLRAQDNGTLRLGGQSRISNASSTSAQRGETPTGEKVYEKYYKQPVIRILTPLFFVSISSNPCAYKLT